MRKVIYAIGVSLFLAFMAFHVTTSLTNPYWGGECGSAGAGDWKWGIR